MSYISCPAEEVIRASERQIVYIKDRRIDIDEASIKYVMDTKKHFWTKKPYSREEAIKCLNDWNMFGWRSCYRDNEVCRLRELLILANHGDPVMVSAEDAAILWPEG